MVVRKSPDRAVKESQRIAAAAQIATRQARSLIADLRADAVQRPWTSWSANWSRSGARRPASG